MSVEFVLRSRRGYVTWAVPSEVLSSEFLTGKKGLSLRTVSKLSIDIQRAAVGHPLEENVWDLFAETDWLGMMRLVPVLYGGKPKPGLVDNRQAIPYSNNSHAFSLDLAGWLRSLTSDSVPTAGLVGTVPSFEVSLENLAISRTHAFAADDLRVIDEIPNRSAESKVTSEHIQQFGIDLDAQILDTEDGPVLRGKLAAEQGNYRVYACRDGVFHHTRHSLVVDELNNISWRVDG